MFQRGAKALLTWTSKQRGKGENSRGEPTDRPTSVLHHVRQLTSRCKLLVLKNLKISRPNNTAVPVSVPHVLASPGQTTLPLSLACMVLITPPNKIRFQGRGKLFPTIEKPQHCACVEKMKSLATAAPKQLNASWNRLNDSTQCEECHRAANSSCKARWLIGGLRVFRPEHTAFYNQMAQMIVPFQIVHAFSRCCTRAQFILTCSGGKPTAAHVSSRPFIFLDHLDERRRSSSTSCWWCSPPAEHPSTNYNTDDLCCC
ncbi:hypothetical protein T07_2244 [Trichinella nelsoni]|uniref:Uncharacterized protein n=1 Tax=Trichinella nelsoni TaxID=6336 RepID=A0A0V0S483_9BILA|nr:hypothetical protein T07_2244 [Trichinella nelsoni]